MTRPTDRQLAAGEYIAQADHGGVAVVNNGGQVTIGGRVAQPAEVRAEEVAAAEDRLARLPLDQIPEPAALPPFSSMPLSRNALFTGRLEDLRYLAATLKPGGTAAVGQLAAATGLGGVGKTELANEFVHRYGQYFAGGVHWVSLADPESVASEIAQCGRRMALAVDYENKPLPEQLELVLAAWQSALPRLVVFDNCEDEELLANWRPPTGASRVLVTSRRATWSAAIGVSALPLGTLERSESIDLMLKFRPDLAADNLALNRICELLGDLPLALHLAGSYLRRYQHEEFAEPQRYLQDVESPAILQHVSMTTGEHTPTGHELHVARTFAISYDRLDASEYVDGLAIALLARAAWFAPDESIPRHLLRLSVLNDDQAEPTERQVADALQCLADVGLIRQEQDGTLALHRLLAAFAKSAAPADDEALAAVAHGISAEAARLNDAGFPGPLAAWVGHLRAVANSAAAEMAGPLYGHLGFHLQTVGDFEGAAQAHGRAIKSFERAEGPYGPNLTIQLVNLGGALMDSGQLVGAGVALKRALKTFALVGVPEDHPLFGEALKYVGRLARIRGDLAEAQDAYERCLAITEAAYPSDSPHVAIAMNNLGRVVKDRGEPDAALELQGRALEIFAANYGKEHPHVAIALANVGACLLDLGENSGAIDHCRQSLKGLETAYGPDHPLVAVTLGTLGGALREEGDLAGAKLCQTRALEIDESAYGPSHPSVARDLTNLAEVLDDQGDKNGAESALGRAASILEAAYGPSHPLAQRVRERLATFR